MYSPNAYILHELLCAALLLCAATAHAQAPAPAKPCQSERFELTDNTPSVLLQRARVLASKQKYGRARFVYETMLALKLEERDAKLGLARLDSWEHCYESAEARYRERLEQAPRDVEARAGLIDVLLWTERWSEAQSVVDAGLALDPDAFDLLFRRAVVYFRRGDAEEAKKAAERALSIAPSDEEARALRDRLYFNQMRAYVRVDDALGDYPDVYTAALSYWRRLRNFELSLDAMFVERRGGALPKPLFDGQYNAGVSYHFGPLATIGLAGGFGAPNKAMPSLLGKVWIFSQLLSAWSTTLSYSMWDYKGDKTAHILTPVLTFTPTDRLLFELRYYGTWLVLHAPGDDPSRFVSTIALRVVAQMFDDLRVGLSYTYGGQLDLAFLPDPFIHILSHVGAVFADYRLSRSWGLQPYASLERREINERPIWIASFELGTYVRW